MKKLSKSLSKRVLTTLNKDPNFKDAYQMVCNRAKTKPYLVGGKLYRTLIEIMYDYPARSHSCDFDFAAEEIIKKKKYKKKKVYNKYSEEYEYKKVAVPSRYGGSVKMHTESGAQVDLICISDLSAVKDKKQPLSIEGYFGSVPLSVQAIAMDIDRCEIFGKIGLDSINEKYVWVNNESVLKDYIKRVGGTANRYVKRKADSIRFGCPVPTPKRNYVKKYKYAAPTQWQEDALLDFSIQEGLLADFANQLTTEQGQYIQSVLDTNVGAQVFIHEGNLYCVFNGATFMYNGSAFTLTQTNTAV